MDYTRLPQSKTREQLVEELNKRLKLNRGSFTNVASETGSSTPFTVQQGRKVEDPSGLGQQNPGLDFNIPQAPSIPNVEDVPEFAIPEPQNQSELIPNQPSQQMSPAHQILQSIFTQSWEPQLPSVDQLDYLYRQTGKVYGIQSLPDGSVLNNDGSVTRNSGQPPMPIATMPDGTILWSDGFVREKPPEGLAGYLAGVSGLSQLVFGRDQTVTQGYGNYNPTLEPGSGYNLGTDFRTRDLTQRQLYAPIPMEVVQVFQDDGTRWGTQSGHQGYGNSVLLRLPSGEMIRMSHLSNMGQFQVGQILRPGDLIGTPGQTGNTSGEHLDLEYYNKDGQIDDPRNFKLDTSIYNIGNEVVGIAPQMSQQTSSQNTSSQGSVLGASTSDQPYLGQTINENIIQPTVNAVKSGVGLIANAPRAAGQVLGAATEAIQPGSPQRQQLGQITEQAAQTGGLQAEFGLSEAVKGGENPNQARVSALSRQPKEYNPYRQLLGNVSERIGDTLGIPEGTLSETIAGGPTKRTNQALANEIGGNKPEQVPGIRQNIFDIGQDLKSKGTQAIGQGVKQASEGFSQAGEGLKNLGQRGIDSLANVFKKAPLLGGESQRVIGEKSAGGDQISSFNPKNSTPNDIRDPFFKSGKDAAYSEYIRPENIGDGALSLDLFGQNFFTGDDALSRIGNVFGGSHLESGAKAKYSEWRKAEDERIAEERRREEERARQSESRPSLQDYLSRGKTVDQWFAETGQQSLLDNLRARGINPEQYIRSQEVVEKVAPQPVQGTYTQQQAAKIGSTTGKGVQNITYSSGRTVQAAPNSNLRSDSSGNVQQVLRGEDPVKSQSAQVAYKSGNSGQNIFSRAASAIKNIFSR